MRDLRLVGVTLLIALVAWPTPALASPTGSLAAAAPLPECRYDDVITRSDGQSEWRQSLVDTIYKVRRTYIPESLVATSRATLDGGGRVRRQIIRDLRTMTLAARDAGRGIAVRSAYRSYSQQKWQFEYWVRKLGHQQALKTSARAGHSEHQLGTTIDFRSASSTRAPWEYPDWAATPPGRWMLHHAWEYGFVMSYPRGRRDETCYSYEPWHYRYLGKEAAAIIHEDDLTTRAYLWQTYWADSSSHAAVGVIAE